MTSALLAHSLWTTHLVSNRRAGKRKEMRATKRKACRCFYLVVGREFDLDTGRAAVLGGVLVGPVEQLRETLLEL